MIKEKEFKKDIFSNIFDIELSESIYLLFFSIHITIIGLMLIYVQIALDRIGSTDQLFGFLYFALIRPLIILVSNITAPFTIATIPIAENQELYFLPFLIIIYSLIGLLWIKIRWNEKMNLSYLILTSFFTWVILIILLFFYTRIYSIIGF